MESGLFKIFQWNGKDLFLQDIFNPEHFEFLSHQEIEHEFRMRIEVGLEIEVTDFGQVIPRPSEDERIDTRKRWEKVIYEGKKAAIRERIDVLKKRGPISVTELERQIAEAERKRQEEERLAWEEELARVRAERKKQVIQSIAAAEKTEQLDPWASIKLELLKKELRGL